MRFEQVLDLMLLQVLVKTNPILPIYSVPGLVTSNWSPPTSALSHCRAVSLGTSLPAVGQVFGIEQ